MHFADMDVTELHRPREDCCYVFVNSCCFTLNLNAAGLQIYNYVLEKMVSPGKVLEFWEITCNGIGTEQTIWS